MLSVLLRECRRRTTYTQGFRWMVGVVRDEAYANFPFKPGILPSAQFTDADAEACATWACDRESWDFALENARVGVTMDFYVFSAGPRGELVTNVYLHILADTEAVICETDKSPVSISLQPAG